jgi:formamidopyrimidine-DNA glycosylase
VPELPEVEVVRRGLERGVAGRTLQRVEVHHPRAVRRHEAGAADFTARLAGATVLSAQRRGKYLWLPLDTGEALTGHLGMSGQLLVVPPDKPDETHLRVRLVFRDGARELRFVDQRTFGGLQVVPLVGDGAGVPVSVLHIALDPLDPAFDDDAFVEGLRRRRTGVKRALLDQTLVSGIGNIYADEALWRVPLHGARPTETLPRSTARALLGHVRDVLRSRWRRGARASTRCTSPPRASAGCSRGRCTPTAGRASPATGAARRCAATPGPTARRSAARAASRGRAGPAGSGRAAPPLRQQAARPLLRRGAPAAASAD